MSRVRALYHRLIPPHLRNPFGMARRRLWDRLLLATTRPKLPPASLLANIQLTPFVTEYLEVGRRSAATIADSIGRSVTNPDRCMRLLDFGCGSARTLRHLLDSGLELHGCDVDREAIEWAQANIPGVEFRINGTAPPLPYPDAYFDVVVAISLFTHFDEKQQILWREEVARVLRPGGIAIISTMGPAVIANFPLHDTPATREKLASDGFVFLPSPVSSEFNAQGAFHTLRGIARFGGEKLELVSWREKGLDGFQDLSIFRRVEKQKAESKKQK